MIGIIIRDVSNSRTKFYSSKFNMLCYRICVVDLTGYCSTFNIQIYSKSKTDLQNCTLNCNFQGGHHLLETKQQNIVLTTLCFECHSQKESTLFLQIHSSRSKKPLDNSSLDFLDSS